MKCEVEQKKLIDVKQDISARENKRLTFHPHFETHKNASKTSFKYADIRLTSFLFSNSFYPNDCIICILTTQ